MKNENTAYQLKKRKRYTIVLIGEGIIIGALSGLLIVLYRTLLDDASKWRDMYLAFAGNSIVKKGFWFVILLAMAFAVYKLLTYEPLISGSGIPQLEGELQGAIESRWYKVLPAKFFGGLLGLFGGLALGREGPSIQLGAMVGKSVSKGFKRKKTEERILLTCGASAGLAAAFQAPLAGVLFSLEEVHKNFSVSLLIAVMSSSLTADYVAASILGTDSVFQFRIASELPIEYYGMIILLGLVLGFGGVLYNWFTLKVQGLYQKCTFLPQFVKVAIPFVLAGILVFTAPQLLGSGHNLIEGLTTTKMLLPSVLFILIGRFVFSAVSFGSGAPGGIFFPLLVIGGYIGGAFALVMHGLTGFDVMYLNNFVLLAMAGYFAAIVRAPLTGIVLIFEMTGSLSQMLSLSLISIVAYVVATMMGSKPIYESLLDNLLKKRSGQKAVDPARKNKVLTEHPVEVGSTLDGAYIKEIEWPAGCLLVSVERGGEELIPHGDTKLIAGDLIILMTDEARLHETEQTVNALSGSKI